MTSTNERYDGGETLLVSIKYAIRKDAPNNRSDGAFMFDGPNASISDRQRYVLRYQLNEAVWEVGRSFSFLGLSQYIQTGIIRPVKPLRFLGNSLECLRQFPEDARHDAGYQLERVQHGKQATDFKPMPSVGTGVEELRVWNDSGTYRVLYIARFADAVYVLHAFQKKTRATSARDLELAKTRYAELMRGRHG